MPPVLRVNDPSTADPCGAPPRPLSAGSGDVFANGISVGRVGDPWEPHACPGDPPHPASQAAGSGTVFANGIPLGRVGDGISCGSSVAAGSPNVFAG